jgi:hypothetical protein
MRNCRIFAAAIAIALAWTATPVRAQINTGTPVVVKQDAPKRVWLKAEVVHADARSIIVREEANERAIHTFTYSPKIQDAMQELFDQGGYQAGDKVKILYEQGRTVALKVRGKPSKPL